MGCIETKFSQCFKGLKANKNANSKQVIQAITYQARRGSQQQGVHELKKNYQLDGNTRLLGEGAFGKVFQATNVHDPDFKVAIKVIDKIRFSAHIDCVKEEVASLQSLDHPNIVRYYETYNDIKYIYMVMEYVAGTALTEKITAQPNQCFGEAAAAGYMKSLFESINHCHALNIVHGDIKPDNIMITADDTVRLIDFGLSKQLRGNSRLTECRGSPYFMAPEVLNCSFHTKADIWSLGVVLYTLVCGYLPFQGANAAEVYRKIRAGDFHFNHPEFASVSEECKDLIRKLLTGDQNRRPNGRDALRHAWFAKFAPAPEAAGAQREVSDDVIRKLSDFRGESTFKKAVMNLLVKTAREDEIKHLRAQFKAIDADGTGMIKLQELKDIVKEKRLNMSVSEAEIAEMIAQIDYQDNQMINYSEFLAATIDVEAFVSEPRLKLVFNSFDTDQSGKITADNIVFAMEKLGKQLQREEVQEIIAKHDKTGDCMLNFAEYKAIFFDQFERWNGALDAAAEAEQAAVADVGSAAAVEAQAPAKQDQVAPVASEPAAIQLSHTARATNTMLLTLASVGVARAMAKAAAKAEEEPSELAHIPEESSDESSTED